MSAFSVENLHNGKTFENYTRFEWSVEVGVVTTFILRLFLPHEFDMVKISVLKTSSQFPVHRLVLILSPAHRSDHSTIIQASIIQF